MKDTAVLDRSSSYIRMDHGTHQQYADAMQRNKTFYAQHPKRVLELVRQLEFSFPGGGQVDRLEHSLQTATRALKAGECDEFVVAALIHDVGDLISPHNHADIAADVIRPYACRNIFWMVKHHGIFQGYYFWDKIGKNKDERERYRDHPAFEMTERFTGQYDQMAFDPHYDTLPLKSFEPMLSKIFCRTPWGGHTATDWPTT